MATSDTLASADRAFVNAVDGVVRGAARRAGRHVQCRRGCTPCCIGVFEITALDAARLVRALRRLRSGRPRVAAALVHLSQEQWRLMAKRFPGDPVIPAALALEARATPGRRVRAGRA
jgi:hypothetical protein